MASALNLPDGDPSTYVLRFYGDPILKEKASRVEPGTLDRNLVDQLVRQCARAWPDPGLGMAAQQLGSLQKVAIARFTAQTDEERVMAGKDGRTVFVLVNPRITACSQETKNCVGEGCLSVPLFRTSVRRHVWVDLEWEDEKFQPHKRRLHHLDAQLAQHECDHLNGICIADRVGRQQRREAERLVAKARARG